MRNRERGGGKRGVQFHLSASGHGRYVGVCGGGRFGRRGLRSKSNGGQFWHYRERLGGDSLQRGCWWHGFQRHLLRHQCNLLEYREHWKLSFRPFLCTGGSLERFL